METFVLDKKSGAQVSCVQEIPENLKGIAIVLHGFASSKESDTVRMLLRRFPEAGIGVVAIDQPAHGEAESAREELRIEACKDSLAAAEAYVTAHWPEQEIFYFGSSFGAYITGLYISTRPHKGRKVFFRSGAVNMPTLFIKDDPTEAEKKLLQDLEEKGYMQPSLDLGSPIRVTKAMMGDLAENDLFAIFDPKIYGSHAVRMVHGAQDDVIDPEAAKRFAEQFDIPITFFAGEGHSISNDPQSPERLADLAIEWFLS
ncbi:MAG: alpha/beta fold hydrolase [Eubacterium sp.]|nr:alpha/beta fold hydrolase [Eubacterium sp.]